MENYSIMTRIISSNNKSYPSSFMENCQFKPFLPFKGFNLFNILSKGLTRPIKWHIWSFRGHLRSKSIRILERKANIWWMSRLFIFVKWCLHCNFIFIACLTCEIVHLLSNTPFRHLEKYLKEKILY